MAIRNFFDKAISYFDTDEVSELEETLATPRMDSQATPQQRKQATVSQPVRSQVSQQSQARAQVSSQSQTQQRPRQEEPFRPVNQRRETPVSVANSAVTIALKYPKKYEDAREIVALLNSNECVLIDFQYMLETQARRCLDFIDGASEVLSGNLQKVGSSMYLLTPVSVVVDIEEMQLPGNGQDLSFDYDMKRR
ncbi:cell division protein SepF [Streptococcus cuniculipharyngis]|uniref:Cell division protein SepF n=1 Tax=Streptococcus cuniculipharyngis TaxID=1562651 RepID=A0A5C5SBI7_9STRE|nr:cell division protein SepF [Streptococcus cuniculipharyngis]TWS96927.1 cell division protein SepF [Streptococcus cuniculipharyngis]